tara:strand:- start:583 stop:1014 length:432 start_codon:yes stop_codon:yes gene_type:complete
LFRAVLLFLSFTYSPAQSEELVEYECSAMFQVDGQVQMQALPPEEFSILSYDDETEFAGLIGPDNAETVAILCHRSSVIPAANDYQVLRAGYPFYIKNSDRTVVLELSGGEYRLRLLDGPSFSKSDEEAIRGMLDSYPTPSAD